MDKVFYRLWYVDFGGVYKYKDFKDENEAIKEAKEMNERIKVWTGKDDTRLEKHSVELINFLEEDEMSEFKFASAMMQEWEQSSKTMDAYDKGRKDERSKIIEILDSADDSKNAMYLLSKYLIAEQLKVSNDTKSPCCDCKSDTASCCGCPKYFEWKERKNDH